MSAQAGSLHGRLGLVVARALMVGSIAGVVVGGLIGTVDGPLVGTFFGAMYGSVLGAVSGVADGVVLTGLAELMRSRWATRVVSGLVWLLAAGAAVVADGPFTVLRHAVGQAVVAAACVLVGASVGPVIAFGRDPAASARGVAGVPLARLAGRVLVWGAAGGAAAGAVTGLVIGIRTYVPTSPFAAVEGAVLGSVSGVVLSALLGGLAVLPRMWAHR